MSMAGRGFGPDFICVGAQKGGTQWLYDQLAFHPDFWMPPVKELHYFDSGNGMAKRAENHKSKVEKGLHKVNNARERQSKPPFDEREIEFIRKYIALSEEKTLDLDAYAHLFDKKGDDLTGDITGAYSTLRKGLIKKIMARFPTLKVMFIARDPIERVWSQLSMRARRPKSTLKVDEISILEHIETRGVASRSYPSQIVKRWRRAVPPDQFGLFFFDDLRKDPADLRQRVVSFLGGDSTVGSGDLTPGFNRKEGLKKLVMTEGIRAALVRHFADELRACADQLGGPAVEWPKKYAL